MVLRKIVNISRDLCNGCGACIPNCAEGALEIVNGKATLVKDTYCDGLGACIGQCPQGAITIREGEVHEFDEKEVRQYLKNKESSKPLTQAQINPNQSTAKPQWPVKLNLIPIKAALYENAELLIAADCAPIAFKKFNDCLLPGKRVALGCPKFDDVEAYAAKLTEILKRNNIASITVAHIEVPCCSGLKWVVFQALKASGKEIPVKEYEITINGEINEL